MVIYKTSIFRTLGGYREIWVHCNNCGKEEQREVKGYRAFDYCKDCEKKSAIKIPLKRFA